MKALTPPPAPAGDEVLAATRRYSEMVEQDRPVAVLSADAWAEMSTRLHAAAQLVTGDRATFVRDRARDAGHRAAFARVA